MSTPTVAAEFTRWLESWWVHPGFYQAGYWDGSVGFCLGHVGMTVCDALIRWARRWRDGPPPFKPPGPQPP